LICFVIKQRALLIILGSCAAIGFLVIAAIGTEVVVSAALYVRELLIGPDSRSLAEVYNEQAWAKDYWREMKNADVVEWR